MHRVDKALLTSNDFKMLENFEDNSDSVSENLEGENTCYTAQNDKLKNNLAKILAEKVSKISDDPLRKASFGPRALKDFKNSTTNKTTSLILKKA